MIRKSWTQSNSNSINLSANWTISFTKTQMGQVNFQPLLKTSTERWICWNSWSGFSTTVRKSSRRGKKGKKLTFTPLVSSSSPCTCKIIKTTSSVFRINTWTLSLFSSTLTEVKSNFWIISSKCPELANLCLMKLLNASSSVSSIIQSPIPSPSYACLMSSAIQTSISIRLSNL